MKQGVKIDPPPREVLAGMYEVDGFTISTISRCFGVSNDTTRKWLRSYGMQARDGYPRVRSSYEDLSAVHVRHFVWMQQRAGSVGGCDFTWDREGCIKFIECIGPVPVDMVRPSVGRVDHLVGYRVGNFAWQEKSENDSEVAKRVNPRSYWTEDSYRRMIETRRKVKDA